MILPYFSSVAFVVLETFAVSSILNVVLCHEITYTGDAHVEEGKPFQITCLVSQLDTQKWTRDGIIIPHEDEDYKNTAMDMKNGFILLTLKVEYAKPRHTGEYRCNSFSERSHRIDVVSPNFVTTGDSQEIILDVKEPIKLICDVDESDTFPVSWYHEGHRVLAENDPRIRVEGKNLIIFPSQEKDSGNYTCDTVSKFSRPIEGRGRVIHVKSSPKIEPFPHQLRVQVGQDLKVECKVQGYPLPWITWYIDNITAEEERLRDNRIEILPNSDAYPNAILLWRNITFEDKRTIICQAKNSVNVIKSSSLIVIRRFKDSSCIRFDDQQSPRSKINWASSIYLPKPVFSLPQLSITLSKPPSIIAIRVFVKTNRDQVILRNSSFTGLKRFRKKTKS